jgi:phage replication O-like protein O
MEQTHYYPPGGYTKVPNNMMRALYRFHFNGTQFRTIIFLIRMTSGWNKGSRAISYKSIAKELNLDKRSVRRTIKTLIQNNVIIRQKSGRWNVWTVNHDIMSWELLITRRNKRTQMPPLKGHICPPERGRITPFCIS